MNEAPEVQSLTRPEDVLKACKTCGVELPLTEFHRAEGKFGRMASCRHCHAKKDAAEYWADPDAARAKHRAQRAKNIEAYRKRGRDYYRKNRDSFLAKKKAKYREQPELFRDLGREYRRSRPWVGLVGKARIRAEKAGLPFNLDHEWGAANWTGKCAVTGAPFQPERGKRWSPSIDRIIPALGYVQANCRFVLWSVNTFKSDGTDAEMIEVARLIVEATRER